MDYSDFIEKIIKNAPKEITLQSDEIMSKDGTKVYCSKCGKLRWELRDSKLICGQYWAKVLCDCEEQKRRERERAEEIERIKTYYNQEKYTECPGRLFKEVRFSDSFYSTLPESQNSAKERLLKYCSILDMCYARGIGFYLYSDNRGNAKTSLMSCVRNEIIENAHGCIMVSQPQVISAARNDREFFDAIKKVKFLLFDDIGSSELKAYESMYIHEIIDYRYRNILPTCFTANYLPIDLSNRGFEEQTTDRIKSLASIIKIEGESMRGLF